MLFRWMRFGPARSNQPAPRSPAQQARAPLGFDTLEDRSVPSTLTHSEWQAQRFHLDDVAVASDVSPSAAAGQPVNQSFGALIGLDRAFADYPYRGQGYSVAVIDTGIDYRHPDLGGGWGQRVVAGYDFVNNDNDPLDDNGHGTHVAGIIGSSNGAYSGVAPSVNLIALKVLDAAGAGSFGDVEAALQWVVQHQAQYNIVAVNLSLGAGNFASNPYSYLEDEFNALKAHGVVMAVAAGNSFYSYGSQIGLAYPASSPAVVSVGAVWARDFGAVNWFSGARDFSTGPDRVASFSQRSGGLDLLAPGALITSTYLNGAYQSMAGTSMAAPVVAGAAALLHQALDAQGSPAHQDAILQLLQSSGAVVFDGDNEHDNVVNSGLTFRRLNVAAALAGIPGSTGDGSPVLSAIPDQNISPGGSRTINLIAHDPDGDPITFAARIVGGDNSLYTLRQQLGLTYLGDYYLNAWGHNEKWLGGASDQWYCLLPNGELRRWAGTMSATLASANLVATVSAACYADPSLLWNAQPSGTPAATLTLTGNQLTLHAGAGYVGTFQVEVTASDGPHNVTRTFRVTVANQAPVWTTIANQTLARTEDQRTVTFTVSDPEGDALTVSAAASPGGAVLSIHGNQLTIDPADGYVGSFTVFVTAGDGINSSTISFNVEVANAAPTLDVPANLTIRRNRKGFVWLATGDADGDRLTFTARMLPSNYLAYQLDRQLRLTYQGSYFRNSFGLKEKWVATVDPQGHEDWYCILPNGDLRRHGGTLMATLDSTNLVAKLGRAYYLKPQLLWNARWRTTPAVKLAVNGNLLTIAPPRGYVGQLFVEVSVSDGYTTTRKVIGVRVT
ncbi:MAG: S8 family serine peptidase [Gemmataceae bacterium]|nr:S8 family serine peptidase [Gemmataceae bacterium]